MQFKVSRVEKSAPNANLWSPNTRLVAIDWSRQTRIRQMRDSTVCFKIRSINCVDTPRDMSLQCLYMEEGRELSEPVVLFCTMYCSTLYQTIKILNLNLNFNVTYVCS